MEKYIHRNLLNYKIKTMKTTKIKFNNQDIKNMSYYQIGMWLFCFIILGFTNLHAQDSIHNPDIIDRAYAPIPDSMKVYTYVQVKPKFYEDLNKYISDNIQYPDSAKKNNIHGTVYISFIIEKNGSISSISVLRSSSHISLDNEAKRLISTMPNWTPGEQNRKAVRVQYMIPIQFKLQ